MEGCARRARISERCIYRLMQKVESLRDRQRRWRRGHSSACQRDNGTDRAKIVRMLILVMARRRQLLRGLDRRRCLRRDCVKVTERKHQLDDERKKRQPRAKPDVRSDPLHADSAPRRKDYTPLPSTLQHNIARTTLECQLLTSGNNTRARSQQRLQRRSRDLSVREVDRRDIDILRTRFSSGEWREGTGAPQDVESFVIECAIARGF